MWESAGLNLKQFDGKPVAKCIPELDAAIAVLKSEPKRFIAMNPANGWGGYASLVPALEALRRQLSEAQETDVVDVSY